MKQDRSILLEGLPMPVQGQNLIQRQEDRELSEAEILGSHLCLMTLGPK